MDVFGRKIIEFVSLGLACLLCTFISGCGGAATENGTAYEPVRVAAAPNTFIHYVLFVNRSDLDPAELVKRHSNDKLKLINSPTSSDSASGVQVTLKSVNDRPLPDENGLPYFSRGFSEEEAKKLRARTHAISIVASGPFNPEHQLLRDTTMCVYRMAEELDAHIYDAADSLTFTPDAFYEIRAQEIEKGYLSANQFGVRAYRVDGGLRCVSMGLEKFGQPNLGIAIFAEHHMDSIDSLMVLAMQQCIESNKVLEPGLLKLDVGSVRNSEVRIAQKQLVDNGGGSGKATMRLVPLKPEPGDPELMLALGFESPQGETLWKEQSEVLKQVYGKSRDISTGVSPDDIDAAVQKARGEASELLENSEQWDIPGRRLKVAIILEETNEILWCEVQSWEGTMGKAILLGDPLYTDEINSGEVIEYTREMIMDFELSDSERVLSQGGVDELVKQMQGN